MQYKIIGEPTPVVQCDLNGGEALKTESGSMVWMSPNMEMSTSSGGLGKALGRALSGEKLFQNVYTAKGGPGMVTFGSSFIGSIRALEITPNNPIVCQKRAFLASEMSVDLSVFFQKRFGAGLLGGEGFVLQKLSGNGIAFVEVDGYAVEYELQSGQTLIVSTGALAMCDATCTIDVQSVKGAKNVLFGGEGFFNTKITGPGKVTLQTTSVQSFAMQLQPYMISAK
ncbi:MAG: TIGR00266 family protein [Oscillospiraceae bacterium]|nr:TIGR00266 family protein [Oscillospiraceae bacterium]